MFVLGFFFILLYLVKYIDVIAIIFKLFVSFINTLVELFNNILDDFTNTIYYTKRKSEGEAGEPSKKKRELDRESDSVRDVDLESTPEPESIADPESTPEPESIAEPESRPEPESDSDSLPDLGDSDNDTDSNGPDSEGPAWSDQGDSPPWSHHREDDDSLSWLEDA